MFYSMNMKIFISDLSKISKKRVFVEKYSDNLTKADKIRFENMTNPKRRLQFLVGRMMIYHFCGRNFKVESSGKLTHKNTYLSLTHSHNLVALALSDFPIGIDTEYTVKKRNFKDICLFLHWKKCSDLNSFYKKYTQYEADLKIGEQYKNPHHTFLSWKKYIICVAIASKEQAEVFECIF